MPLSCFRIISLLILTLSCSFSSAANIEKLAADDWLYLTSSNFEIITDLDAERGQRLIEDLETYRHFSIQMMGLHLIPNIQPLKILAIGNTSNFKNLNFPETWAGVFSLDIFGYSAIANVSNYRGSLKGSTFARQVLFHEYNHFLMRFTKNITRYPMWYDEGMAEYWGSFKFDGEKIYIGDPSAVEFRIHDLLNEFGNIILSSEKLFNTAEMPMTSIKENDKSSLGKFYAQSFFLVHYFNSSPELRASLDKYIQYLNTGYTERDALQKAFNMTYAELDKSAKKYLSKNLLMRVGGIQQKSVHFQAPAITLKKIDQAQFYSFISEVLPNYDVIGADSIKNILEKNVAMNPHNATAKSLLLMHDLADNPEKLEQELEQTAPQNPVFLTYKGDKLRDKANMQRSAGIDSWELNMKLARNLYRSAIEVDPFLPMSYFGLGNAYNFLPATEPLQEGVTGFNTASLYARDKFTFSNLADLLIRMDKGIDALPALRNTLAFSKEKEKSIYSLILDNLEMLKDTSSLAGKIETDGLKFDDETIYTGAVVNGKPEGAGKVVRANGSYFEGNFIDGIMQGKGKIVTSGGFIYEGEFQNGIARGKGKITYPADSKLISYTGDIYYSFPHGKGIEKNKIGKYEGEFWYSWYQGAGAFTTNTKTLLQGRWIQGRYQWPEINGTQFVGFVNEIGNRHGYGICLTKEKSLMDWCTFKDGVLQQRPDSKEKTI